MESLSLALPACLISGAHRGQPPRSHSHSGDVFSREGIGGVADEKTRLAHGSERQDAEETEVTAPLH